MGGIAYLEPGKLFAGRYEVQRLLGEGDRKRTYLAYDTKLDGLVALSLVKPEAIASDPQGTEREARVLGRIGRHPNIVSLYDYEIGKDSSAQYIVFQYLGGGTLTEYLRHAGEQSLDDILRLGRQLSRGLSHLHNRGLIHRDVSPDNIWLDERHAAHLGDFDSAITVAGTDTLRPITTGSFAAPEEIEGKSLDVRADLFSLGGVLYVAATGERRPGDLALLRTRRPGLPSAFGDLVASLLSASPEGGLPTPRLCCSDLTRFAMPRTLMRSSPQARVTSWSSSRRYITRTVPCRRIYRRRWTTRTCRWRKPERKCRSG